LETSKYLTTMLSYGSPMTAWQLSVLPAPRGPCVPLDVDLNEPLGEMKWLREKLVQTSKIPHSYQKIMHGQLLNSISICSLHGGNFLSLLE